MTTAPPPESQVAQPAKKSTVAKDITAGMIDAVVNVPDGLASAALAGVNPIYGLYTAMTAPLVGGLLSSNQLMMVATTSAGAIAASEAIAGFSGDDRDQALFLFVIMIGVFQLIAGLLKLGRLTRYVAHSVMTGFLAGVALLLVLDQLAPFVGYNPEGPNEVAQALNLLSHVSEFDPATMIVGISALLIVIFLGRTRLGNLSSLVALVVPAIAVAWLGWDSVQLVNDISEIPRGVPLPNLPDFSVLNLDLVLSALAIAIVVLVQGAGVSQSFPNRDGSPINPSRDFLAQGAANVVAGLFRGIPAGGSVGQTALNVSLDAQTRLASITAGVAMFLIVLLIPGVVGLAPMAALAALMIMAGVSAIDLTMAQSIWQTGWASRLPMLVTFIATLFLSIPIAVGIGVILSILLFISSSSTDIKVYELVKLPNGRYQEQAPPKKLPSHQVTMLNVVGSVFFAGARSLEDLLPSPAESENPVVILRMRGQQRIGSTFLSVVDKYSDDLEKVGGKFYLSGVDAAVFKQIQQSHRLDLAGQVSIFAATDIRGESSDLAFADAMTWTIERRAKSATTAGSESAEAAQGSQPNSDA